MGEWGGEKLRLWERGQEAMGEGMQEREMEPRGGERGREPVSAPLMFCLPLLLCHCPPFLFYETFLTHSLPSAKAFFLFRLESYPRFYF